jgi:uncharacterized protein YkwD
MARALVVAATLVALVIPAAAQPVATTRSDESQAERLAALETAILVRINELRGERGLAKLRPATGLRAAAGAHSRSMVSQGFFAHESPDGTTFDSRVERFYPSRGFRYWRVAENIAAMTGVMSADEAVDLWLESPGHRRVIFDPQWREAGLGAVRAASTRLFPGAGEATALTLDVGVRRS